MITAATLVEVTTGAEASWRPSTLGEGVVRASLSGAGAASRAAGPGVVSMSPNFV
jgi:hypothetical protein